MIRISQITYKPNLQLRGGGDRTTNNDMSQKMSPQYGYCYLFASFDTCNKFYFSLSDSRLFFISRFCVLQIFFVPLFQVICFLFFSSFLIHFYVMQMAVTFILYCFISFFNSFILVCVCVCNRGLKLMRHDQIFFNRKAFTALLPLSSPPSAIRPSLVIFALFDRGATRRCLHEAFVNRSILVQHKTCCRSCFKPITERLGGAGWS